MRFETLAVHAGQHVDRTTGAVTPAIHLSTTFEREADGSFPHGHIYSRDSNPNRTQLEECLAALEGGAACAAFASGSAATAALFQALRPGDRVVAADDAYYGTIKMLREIFEPWGLQFTLDSTPTRGATFVDGLRNQIVLDVVRESTRRRAAVPLDLAAEG